MARLSVRRLSDMAGISNPYLSQIERGLRRPSAEILQQIARALRISAETLYVRAGILDAREVRRRSDRGHPGRADPDGRAEADVAAHLSVLPPGKRGIPARDNRGLATAAHRRSPVERRPRWARASSTVMAQRGGPLHAHLAPGPARYRRRGRDERVRPGAGRGAGPIRGALRGLHPGRQRRLPGDRRRRARLPGPSRPGRAAAARSPRSRCPELVPAWTAGVGGPAGRAGRRPGDRSTPSTPTTGCRAWPATPSSTSWTCRCSSTFHTLDRVKADASPEELLGCRAGPAGPGRSRDRRLRRRRRGLLLGGGRPARRAVRGRTRPDRHRGARRRPRLLQPRRPGPGPPGRRAAERGTGRCCSPGGSSR